MSTDNFFYEKEVEETLESTDPALREFKEWQRELAIVGTVREEMETFLYELGEEKTGTPDERDKEINHLVNRLRRGQGHDMYGRTYPTPLDTEAADEIERLNAYCRDYAEMTGLILNIPSREREAFFNALTELDKTEEERIYPFMACPNEERRLDPLEGCSECRGVGIHSSIPNPEWG